MPGRPHLWRQSRDGSTSEAEIERILNQYVCPAWKGREFIGVRRGDVVKLLDTVQDAKTARQADSVLAIVRGLMNWHASRSDDYTSPIARGMRRTDPKTRQRDRILDDDEIRLVWRAAEASGTFGAILRIALMTAQRRAKIAALRWDDVTVDGVWNVPAELREKGNGGALVLPEKALTIIRAQNLIGDNPYVFAGRGDGHFNGYSPCKRAFDRRVMGIIREAAVKGGDDPETVGPLPRWTLHDLRRTARSLMARAGVRPNVAERVMGHAIMGVEGGCRRLGQIESALKRFADLNAGKRTSRRELPLTGGEQSPLAPR